MLAEQIPMYKLILGITSPWSYENQCIRDMTMMWIWLDQRNNYYLDKSLKVPEDSNV